MKKLLLVLALGIVFTSCDKVNKECTDAQINTENKLHYYNESQENYYSNPTQSNQNQMNLAQQGYEQAVQKQNNVCN